MTIPTIRDIVKDSMREAFYVKETPKEGNTEDLQEQLLILEEFDRELEVWISGKH